MDFVAVAADDNDRDSLADVAGDFFDNAES